MAHRAELGRALRSFRFERTDDGRCYFPKAKIFVGGSFRHSVNGLDVRIDPNLVVAEGIDDILNVYFHGSAQRTAFYIAPFSGNVDPTDGLTAATFTATQTEFTNYTQSTRVVWNEAASASQSVSNTANPALFTIGSGGGTIWGVGLMTASVKSATTGVLVACTKFSAARSDLLEADKLSIEYTITGTSE